VRSKYNLVTAGHKSSFSFMSAITLLGTPAEMYVYGTQYCLLVLAYPFVMYATVEW